MNADITGAIAREGSLLDAARGGDEEAFRALVEPHLKDLRAHGYRMLGSVHDADDAVQDALLRAWRGLRNFQGRSSLRSWLYRITTNACLDVISRRPQRVLPIEREPAADPNDDLGDPRNEPVWVEPYADEQHGLEEGLAAPEARYGQRESVELAFIVALQHLPGSQRAALILRDVLGFSSREVAEVLDTTVPSVNGALRRARKAVEERLPKRSQQATLRILGDAAIRKVGERYIDAWERGGCRGDTRPAGQGREVHDAPATHLVRRSRRNRDLPETLRTQRAMARASRAGKRAVGLCLLRLGRGQEGSHPVVPRRAHPCGR
jgi:RNA polymerase sigma-70 factor, ECF subfamily